MLIELTLLGGAMCLFKRKKMYELAKKSKKLMKNMHSALTKDERREHQLTLASEQGKEMQNFEDSMAGKQYLILSGVALGGALLRFISPLLAATSIIIQFYLMYPLLRLVWQDLKAGRILTVYLESIIIFLGMILKGYLALSAIVCIGGNVFANIIQRTGDHAEKRLTNIFANHPTCVWVEKDGVEVKVDFKTLQTGDIVIVNAGEVIPVDGVIQSGLATIDQHLLTGESQPVERTEGEKVFAVTLVLTGRIRVLVETAGKDTVAAKIGQVLDNTQHYKEHLMVSGQEIANKLMPITWAIAVVTWPLLGSTAALSILFASLGFNMAFFGPLTVLTYLQIFSRHGILVKDGRILDALRQVDTIVFDKTGTLTQEQPQVGKIYTFCNYGENTVLCFAAVAEYRQPHPIAKAILAKAQTIGLDIAEPDTANYEVGYGIKVKLDKQTICVGSANFMQREKIELLDSIIPIQQQAEEQGYSLIYIGVDQHLAGILEIRPSIRPEAIDIIYKLKQRGYALCIISGDHEQPTRNLANQLGIDRYFAETLPENKANLVKQLREEGNFVCFIGDGINDSIALKSAQISISLKGASTAATDTAQIILMDGTLHHLKSLFQLTDEFETTMNTNFLTTIVPGMVCIGGVYFLHFGIAASMATYYVGSLAGLSNSLLPLIKHTDKTSE